MKTGISTACFFGRAETEDALGLIRHAGGELCEVFLETFYEYRPEFAKRLAPLADGLRVNSVHALTSDFEPHLFSRGRRQRGDGFYWLDQVMRSAQLLGAESYTFHGFNRRDGADDFGFYAERLREAIAFCARYGITLRLENVWWSLYNRPGVFAELKRHIPELTGVFDIKQARRSGYPYQAYIADMAGSLAYAHLSDVDADGNIRLPGEGLYDFTELLKRLRDNGFDGGLIIEVYSDNFSDENSVKQSLDFLNEIVYKLS